MAKQTASGSARQHLYELDLVRVVTAICVVGVHATYFTLFFNTSPLGFHVQNGVVAALHFTREVFLSITAFVLVYVYGRRPLSVWSFWSKRGLGVLLPYLFWSILYTWLAVPHDPIQPWLLTALGKTLTGTASYQLYFILLSVEFYLALPLFLPILRRLGERHPWPLLIGSGALQIAMLYVDHNYVQAGAFSGTPLGQFVNGVQASFLPLYQFYAVLGGVAALHADRLRPWVQTHARWIVGMMIVGLAALWTRYGVGILLQGWAPDYATSVFQPVMVFYSAAAALFLYWLGVAWATSRSPTPPLGQRFWSLLSDASFGIYLIHPLILNPAMAYVAPILSTAIPVAVRVATIWGLAAGVTALACVIMLHVPLVSRLIGRPWTNPLPSLRRSQPEPSTGRVSFGEQEAVTNRHMVQSGRPLM